MEQGGRMDEFDDTGQRDAPLPGIAAEPGAEEEKRRTNPFAATGEDILPNLSDERHIGLEVFTELKLNLLEIFADEGEG
jgi:hypothetical protein